MENREILIANTKTQTRSKITTDASTLGELKEALIAANIPYTGMTFTEGISKTQLLSDDTQLPTNVMYKGQPTNNLVILLTNTKKNIASGAMTRQEIYQYIKEHNLQETVKERFGKNYTVVSTADLSTLVTAENSNHVSYNTQNPKHEETKSKDAIHINRTAICNSILDMVKLFVQEGVLDEDEIEYIINNLDDIDFYEPTNEKTNSISSSDGNITDSDIDDMIDDLGI